MPQKPFAWSYSKLKNFESCPKKHYHVDLLKDCREEDSQHLRWGNEVHKAIAKRISLGSPLPEGMKGYENWCRRFLDKPGRILTEQQLAINKDFGACEWFASDAWYRAIADVLVLRDDLNVALAADWKTGKILEDSVQLALMAACIFAHYPQITAVRTEFIWLKEGDDVSSREDFTREQMPTVWRNIWHRIEELEAAYNTTTYPAKPGYLCRKWCPVSSCPHHGK